jgi:hypothetical protein
MKILKRITLVFILLVLFMPLIQARYRFIREKPLNGYYRLHDAAYLSTFTWKRWFSGEFSDYYGNGTEDHAPFRNSLFRLVCQVDYSLFGITHSTGFIAGRNGNFYEEDYIHEYNGDFFTGDSTNTGKLLRLKNICDTLQSKGRELIVVFEPGKASVYPDDIPERFHPERRTLSNYNFWLRKLDELNVPCLDLNGWFMKLRDTCRYPLFPKYGMHWSIYGMALALDTLDAYIGMRAHSPLPEVTIGRITLSDSLRETDNDIGDMLNLVFPLPKITVAYPEIRIANDPSKRKLKVLVVADSYYKNIASVTGSKLFASEEYWYYNSKLYPWIIDTDHPVYVDKKNLAAKLSEFDVILLMSSEINLHCHFWNFIDEAYAAFHPDKPVTGIENVENTIRNQREWFRFVWDKSVQENRTLEETIHRDAEYTYGQSLKKN